MDPKIKRLYLGKSERLDLISAKELKVDMLCLWWRPRRVSAVSPRRRLVARFDEVGIGENVVLRACLGTPLLHGFEPHVRMRSLAGDVTAVPYVQKFRVVVETR